MRTLIFDVPAEHGGALTILDLYYKQAILDKDNKYIFILSTPELKEQENIKIVNYPWVKKSWFHRLFFDYFVAPRIVKKIKPNRILSLQNTFIKNTKNNVYQTIYLHQPLPFVEKRFSIKESFKFWIYQNLISKIIFNSLNNANKVIVQTNWMKEACIKIAKVDSKKITIQPPEITIDVKNKYKVDTQNNVKYFIYPASGLKYKNHQVIVDALSKIKNKNLIVYFTLNGNENSDIKNLYDTVQANDLSIKFIGHKKINEIYKMYEYCTLIFPSYIETFGLPLLEARRHETPIIASNCVFSREILDNYDKASFFDPNDSSELARILSSYVVE